MVADPSHKSASYAMGRNNMHIDYEPPLVAVIKLARGGECSTHFVGEEVSLEECVIAMAVWSLQPTQSRSNLLPDKHLNPANSRLFSGPVHHRRLS
jgi:hypothetical protein